MIAHAIQKLYLRYRGYHPLVCRLYHIIRAIFIESNYAIQATFSYLLMLFVPQFTEATDIITLESVIFPMRFCVYIYKKFIASSNNNIFYIQIRHFTQQTMLNMIR